MNDIYFNIRDGISIVYGSNGAVVYRKDNCRMYDVFLQESHILQSIEEGMSYQQLKTTYLESQVDTLIKNLLDAGVVYQTNTFIPREDFNSTSNLLSQFGLLQLKRCFIEMPFSCEMNCSHCNSRKLFGCFSCSKPSHTNSLSFDENYYINLIDDVAAVGCRQYYFYGGDLIANFSFLEPLVKWLCCNYPDIKIYLITPAHNYLDWGDWQKKVKMYHLIPIYNILWNGHLPLLNHQHKYNFIVELADYESFKVHRTNTADSASISSFCIYSKNRNISMNYIEERFIKDNRIAIRSLNSIYHPCLCGQLAFKSDKKVYSCKDVITPLGDLQNMSFQYFLETNEKYLQAWTSLNSTCQNCKFNNSCLDCRSYDENVSIKTSCNIAMTLQNTNHSKSFIEEDK